MIMMTMMYYIIIIDCESDTKGDYMLLICVAEVNVFGTIRSIVRSEAK